MNTSREGLWQVEIAGIRRKIVLEGAESMPNGSMKFGGFEYKQLFSSPQGISTCPEDSIGIFRSGGREGLRWVGSSWEKRLMVEEPNSQAIVTSWQR